MRTISIVSVVFAAAACTLSSGCLELDRADGLRPGDIRVHVVDAAGADVVGARVFAVGTPRVGVSDDAGVAIVGPMPFGDYMLRAVSDDAGGFAEDVVVIDSQVVTSVPRLVSGVTEIAVGALGNIGGTVAACPAGTVCRVVAFRTAGGYALPIEGTALVGADGRWQIDGLAAGDVELAAYSWTPPLSTVPLDQLRDASRPTADGQARGTVGDDDIAITLSATPAAGTASFSARIGGPDGEERPASSGIVSFYVPTTTTAASTTTASSTLPGTDVAVPIGVFDLNGQIEGFGGRLEGFVGVRAVPAPYLPIALSSYACATDDCNNDGVVDVISDDVDGDGVPDDQEPTACREAGRGADRDGDCLCDAIDPLPDCQSNDPLACAAVTAPVCN